MERRPYPRSFIYQTAPRYPINKKTILPAARTLLFLLVLALFLFKILVPNDESNPTGSIITLIICTLSTITSISKLLQTLKFISVPTELFAVGNMQLVQNFLEHERFVVFRHPEAPEVFQIISKDINAHNLGGGEQREILIFIADDKRILINSHFTSIKEPYFQRIRQGHHREMATMLQRYIDSINTTDAGKAVKRR